MDGRMWYILMNNIFSNILEIQLSWEMGLQLVRMDLSLAGLAIGVMMACRHEDGKWEDDMQWLKNVVRNKMIEGGKDLMRVYGKWSCPVDFLLGRERLIAETSSLLVSRPWG